MRVIVSDTSCIIDLGKSGLARVVLQLPYTFVMPDVLFEDELLSFGPVGKEELRALGLQVVELDPQGTSRAFEHFAQYQALAVHDCFALALAEQTEDCILLTGDSALRRIALGLGIEVHGVLYVVFSVPYEGKGSRPAECYACISIGGWQKTLEKKWHIGPAGENMR